MHPSQHVLFTCAFMTHQKVTCSTRQVLVPLLPLCSSERTLHSALGLQLRDIAAASNEVHLLAELTAALSEARRVSALRSQQQQLVSPPEQAPHIP